MRRALATLLSFVAGFVDACTYIGVFGLFVAQVTGSFVVVGVHLVAHEPGALGKMLAIPVFLLAAVVTTVLVRAVGGSKALALCLAFELLLLAGFFGLGLTNAPFHDPDADAALATGLMGLAAMGVQSALVRLVLGTASTNVMTTNTTQLAIDATEALIGWMLRWRGRDAAAIAHDAAAAQRFAQVLPLALGFLAGTLIGAVAFVTFGFASAAAPVAIMAGIVLWTWRRPP